MNCFLSLSIRFFFSKCLVMLHFSFTSTSYIRAFSHWNVLWWGQKKCWGKQVSRGDKEFYCNFSVSELLCQQLLLLPENADSDCRRQNCCFYSLHRCKPDETRLRNCVHEKRRVFETQGPSNPHTSTERVPGNWTVLSVISFLACASMQMHSNDHVSRWQSAMTVTTI